MRWQPPDVPVSKYVISAVDRWSSVSAVVPGDAAEIVLSNLKAATGYAVSIRACVDADCEEYVEGEESASVTTEAEHWRILGSGNSFATATRLVPDGKVGSYAFKLDGRLQLYYNPLQREEKGVKIAEPVASRIESMEDATTFRGVPGFGLLRSPALQINLFQSVPLAGENKVRLFFEAQGADGRTRILYLDSQDGYTGRDFHRGAPTRCETPAD